MRRRLTLGLLIALVTALAAAASGLTGTPTPTISDVGDVTFPDRSYILSLPQPTELDSSQVTGEIVCEFLAEALVRADLLAEPAHRYSLAFAFASS